MKSPILAFSAFLFVITHILSSCGPKGNTEGGKESEFTGQLPDTLRVGTLYSPTSYFIYREEEMGYDYNLVQEFAEDKGIEVALTIAPSLSRLVEMLDSGEIDVAAYEIPVTSDYRSRVIACGPYSSTTQVLVQPRKSADRVTDITDLVGRDVYVEKGSKYQQRINNINENLGGGINIHVVDKDTLITEDLIEMVSEGEIPLTIVDSDIARINKTYYPDLDINLEVSFPQRSAWGVAPGAAWLADSINAWFETEEPSQENAMLLKRYFESSKKMPLSPMMLSFSGDKMSPFDDIFRKYAESSGLDWRLLASQGYVESRYEPSVVSWAGARGVMQIMPGTARGFGVSASALSDNDTNIGLAAKIIKTLDSTLAKDVPDPAERRKFVLAAYNSGLAHIRDAIALAGKYGKNPQVWDNNVESALLMKSNPQYFNDPVCRYGYFRGTETTRYVKDVMALYRKACDRIK